MNFTILSFPFRGSLYMHGDDAEDGPFPSSMEATVGDRSTQFMVQYFLVSCSAG